jgi:hypothetical protein
LASIPDVGSDSTLQRRAALGDRAIVSKHAPHPRVRLGEICCAGVGDCLDVGAVPRATEQSLEDNRRGAASTGISRTTNGTTRTPALAVEAVDIEEQVRRRVLPPHAHLTVALGSLDVRMAESDRLRKRGQRRRGPA